MKDLQFHFGNSNTKNVIFGFPNFVHFGDRITFINLVKNLNLESYKINPTNDHGRELCSYFFDDDIFTNEPPTHHFDASPDVLTEAYKCRYHKIKYTKLIEKKYITYSFGSSFESYRKTPPYLENVIVDLKNIHGDIVVEIGPNIGISKSIELMLNSFLFIGLDNGGAHLCRCTDTPSILIEHLWNLERGFPTEYYKYNIAKSYEDVMRCVKNHILPNIL